MSKYSDKVKRRKLAEESDVSIDKIKLENNEREVLPGYSSVITCNVSCMKTSDLQLFQFKYQCPETRIGIIKGYCKLLVREYLLEYHNIKPYTFKTIESSELNAIDYGECDRSCLDSKLKLFEFKYSDKNNVCHIGRIRAICMNIAKYYLIKEYNIHAYSMFKVT